MYICVCHALNEGDVKSAFAHGATEANGVFCHHGIRPHCGRCVPVMEGMAHRHQHRPDHACQGETCRAAAPNSMRR